jgi:hypothetical protein
LKKFLFIIVLFSQFSYAQVVGTKTYRMLDLPMPARAAALGGTTMSIWGDDINLYFSNPALLNRYSAKQLALNYSNYVTDINYGNVAYAHNLKSGVTIAGGIQFLNYGKFDRRDEYDVSSGKFNAADYSFNLSAAKPLADTSFNIGATLKTIYSHYDSYYSFGNAIDLGMNWHHKSGFTASIMAKNVGVIWKPYNKGSDKELLPYDMQLGVSYKVKKAPFRLIFVYDQITRWDLTYLSSLSDTSTVDPFNSSKTPKTETKWQKFKTNFKSDANKLGLHTIIATEVVLTKNFNIRVGYNYRLHKEMMLPDKRGGNGITFGFGIGINRFKFNYAFAKYATAGNSHIISLTTILGTYVKTERKKKEAESAVNP